MFKTGDKVRHRDGRKGVVTSVDTNKTWAVSVKFENGTRDSYYTNGKLYKKLNICITAGKKEKVYILTDNVYVGERFSYLKLELKEIVVSNEETVTEENSKQFENKIYISF